VLHDFRDTPVAARWLGLMGLIPFGATIVAGLIPVLPLHSVAPRALLAYGAVMLSFLGGVRWGLAIAKTGHADLFSPLLIGVSPSILGWIALLVSGSTGLLPLALGFAALMVADLRLPLAPAWYGALRLPLSVGAIGTLLLGVLV
jgi:hypothetical protein